MINAAVVGYGNIGKASIEALSQCEDMRLAGVVSRSAPSIEGVKVVKDISELENVGVAILCAPSRLVPNMAESYLKAGIRTVDSFDIHSMISGVRTRLDKVAKESNSAAIISAGWDPGSDSVIRALLEAMMPKGITYTNFGPGMSMGHTVAVKAVEGVKDALSMTIPSGTGIHRRMVYVELNAGADFNTVSQKIKNDAYFIHDDTHVIEVPSVDALKDAGHGVNLTRKGVSGVTQNQNAAFSMSINNPALTAQILVSSARAVMKQQAGCYTMIEIPPVDFLSGSIDELVARLV